VIALRLILGGLFVVSSWGKLRYPRIFAEALLMYDVLPENLVTLVALVLPWLELLAGLFMIVGYRYRGSALILGALALLFVFVLSSAVWKGLDISCGCFVGVDWLRVDWKHILVNLFLVQIAGLIFLKGPGVWALEGREPRASQVR
jgi:uncharacterized membrane protein YphA (DoxX/SURF4 family)